MKKFVNKRIAAGKSGIKSGYKDIIESIEKAGHCPFCPENFKYHKKKILEEIGNWLITENSWPYKNTKSHFLIISKTHKENFIDLTSSDFNDIAKLVNSAIKKYKIKGGALTMRFGDTDFTGATVSHLHFHLISPEKNKKEGSKVVNFPIGG